MNQRNGYPGFWHSVLLCVAFVGLQVIFMIPVGVLDTVFHLDLGSQPGVMGVVNLIDCALVLGLAWLIGRPAMAEVFAFRPISILAFAGVIVSIAGAVILLSEADNLVRAVLPPPEWVERILANLSHSSDHLWGTAFLLVLVAPITEELMFRGLILRGLLRRFSLTAAVLLSSMLFGIVHLNPWQFVSAMVMGVIFASWYARTRSLIPTLIGHALTNSVVVWHQFLPLQIRGFSFVDQVGGTKFQPFWFDISGVLLLAVGTWLFLRATPPSPKLIPSAIEPVVPPPVMIASDPPPITQPRAAERIEQGSSLNPPEASNGSAAVTDSGPGQVGTAFGKHQGMAVASLILGVLSVLCLGLLAGLPAIVLGHMACRRARKSPDRFEGAGLAMAGLITGYASILTTLFLTAILAGLAFPTVAKAKAKAESITCVNNLKQVGLAFRIWARDHDGRFPFNSATNPSDVEQTGEQGADTSVTIFQALSNDLTNPKTLVCPADKSKSPAISLAKLGEENISYELARGARVQVSNPQEILARCPIHGHELLCDGSVQRKRGE